jgi:hypothetical protein
MGSPARGSQLTVIHGEIQHIAQDEITDPGVVVLKQPRQRIPAELASPGYVSLLSATDIPNL